MFEIDREEERDFDGDLVLVGLGNVVREGEEERELLVLREEV